MPINQKTLLPTRLKNNMSDCVLAVDVGSTSLKAALIDRDGTVASICTVPYSAPENRFVAEGWIWALKDNARTGINSHLRIQKIPAENGDF